ncbi:MAG: CBS domain-containing protein [Capsulimonadales bacterium]|nr:CBS domain-containing protein [Capsulimonadales bacterium]
MKTLGDIPLRQIPIVEPSASLAEVIRLMEAEPLRTVALVGDEQFFGLFNDDSLAGDLIPPGEDLSLLQVGPYVHSTRVVGEPEMPTDTARALAERRKMTVIPIVENVSYRGVVTIDDLKTSS